MAYVIEGAIIVRENFGDTTYVKVCEQCGYQQPGTTTTRTHGTMNGSFRCINCGNNQSVRIQFG